MLELEFEASLEKSLQIKTDKMATLEARLQESSFLNLQLRQELKAVSHVIKSTTAGRSGSHDPALIPLCTAQVKLNYEALQQRLEEEQPASGSSPLTETGKTVTEWLRESQEATKELLKLKDHLIEVERNVSGFLLLTDENAPFPVFGTTGSYTAELSFDSNVNLKIENK